MLWRPSVLYSCNRCVVGDCFGYTAKFAYIVGSVNKSLLSFFTSHSYFGRRTMQYATLYTTSLFLKTYYLVYFGYILFKYSIYKCYFIFQI